MMFNPIHTGFMGAQYGNSSTNAHRIFEDATWAYSTLFYYDKLGRIVASVNSKQNSHREAPGSNEYTPRLWSYTLYDGLGRVYQAGQKQENSGDGEPVFESIFGEVVGTTYSPNTMNDEAFNTWINANGERTQVTTTYYDQVPLSVANQLPEEFIKLSMLDPDDFDPITTLPTKNLRKRVAFVCYEELFDDEDATYDHATHYAYDIHGNVKSLLQDNPKLAALLEPLTAPASGSPIISHQQRFKRMDYTYDLVSGNVHEVAYQRNEPDQFLHRYHYDADNRITEVRTSDNGNLWDMDARYHYYDHGPLARVELGEHKVQGIDYAYTLQGWIKGINSDALTTEKDMGTDGHATGLNSFFAKDVASYSLHYYEGDYQAVSTTGNDWLSTTAGSYMGGLRRNLYNGNIGMMLTHLPAPEASSTVEDKWGLLGMVYTYDQLNRLVNAEGYMNFDVASNTWGIAQAEKLYQNTFTYDANGNIESQVRYGAGNSATHLIDDLTYLYHQPGQDYTRNRLYAVSDANSNTSYSGDIEGTASFNPQDPDFTNNYGYTEIGELKHDNSEGIEKIDWRVDSKISYIHRVDNSQNKELKFEYDAMGNRIAKHVYSSTGVYEKTTYYVRDASGNIMANYEFDVSEASYDCTERPIYGSSRLGVYRKTVAFVGYNKRDDNSAETGNRMYELSNHLGNVLTTISDRKTYVSGIFVAEVISVTDYSPFGVALEGRSYSSEKYRFGFNGMEGENDISESYFFTTYRLFNAHIGRWLSIDPLSRTKSFITPYNSMSNAPIGRKDPFGDDDYYDEKGRLVYHTENGTNNIRVLLRKDFDNYEAKRYEDYKKSQPTGKAQVKPVWKLGNPPELNKLNAMSVELQVQSKVDQDKVMKQLEESTASDPEKREASAQIILEINLDPNTKKIATAKLYVKIVANAARSKDHVINPSYYYFNDDPTIRYIDDKAHNKIIIAGMHTHPQTGQSNHGPSTPENAVDKRYVDTNVSKECSCDEFVLDKDLYKATPIGGTTKLDRATFNVAKEALVTHSSTH